MKIIVIGDVHGRTESYQKMLRQRFRQTRTVQIGDMGIGFKGVGLHQNLDYHTWFRGNHDNPEKCRSYPSYQGDYGFDAKGNFFWLAGAWSIDRDYRIEGISWWPDEELSYAELNDAIGLYERVKPDYVLSHEAPSKAAAVLLHGLAGTYFAAKGDCQHSRTAQAMQNMLDIHQPKEWVFGHYHIDHSFAVPFYDTKFTCVSELHTYELNTGGNNGETNV